MNKRIVVIGGGLAGASAAHALTKRGYDVTIVERNGYMGGRVRTHLVGGTVVEMGAGFMTRIYTNVHAFLVSSGLDSQLYQQHGSSGVLRNGQVQMATLRTLLGNDALSWGAKLQVVPLVFKALARWPNLDHHAFWKADKYDKRSVADMFSGSNQELLEYMLQPMMNGYFYWAPEYVSEAMLFILGKAALIQGGSYRLASGLQRIPEKAAATSTVLLDHTVKEVRRNASGLYDVVVEHNNKITVLQADGIVCATTASVVPTIFGDLSEQQRAFFQAVDYSSTALIARTYKQEQTRGDKGIAFPRQEGLDLAAITVSREPGTNTSLATLKTYASGTIGKQLCGESDETIISTLTGAMEPARDAVLVGNPEPLAIHVQRWPEALPLFDVGHFKRLRAFENGDIEGPNQAVVFAGDYLGGPFMEGAFTSGVRAAERLAIRLQT